MSLSENTMTTVMLTGKDLLTIAQISINILFSNCRCANDYWINFSDWLNSGNLRFVPKKLASCTSGVKKAK